MTELEQRRAWAEVLAERTRAEFGIREPVRVIITEQGDGPLAGTVVYSDGSWLIIVKGTMDFRKFTGTVLHELAHVLCDGEELKRAGEWGDAALWQKLRALAVVQGNNPWSEQFTRLYRENRGIEDQADRVGRGLGKLIAKGG